MFVCWPPSTTSARPSSADRTSSSTPTRCAGSCAPRRSVADDVVLEVGPGLGSLTLALLEQVASVTAVEIDPVLAAALPHTVEEFARDDVDRVRVATADAMRVDRAARTRRRPRWSRTCPTTWPFRCCCTCSRGSVAGARPRDGAARGGGAAGRRTRVRRSTESPVSRPPGTPTSTSRGGRAQRLLAGAERRLRPGLDDAARATRDVGDARGRLRGRRRGVRATAQDSARRVGVVCRLGCPGRGCARAPPASTRPCAANVSPSKTSPASPTRSATAQLT